MEVVHDVRHPTAGDGLKVTLDVERKASQKIIAELKSVAAKLEWVHTHTHFLPCSICNTCCVPL